MSVAVAKDSFRCKLADAMVGHSMVEITETLADALGIVLHEGDPEHREQLIEEVCASIARKAMQRVAIVPTKT